MSNQVEFEKVTRCIIEPLQRHWGADFDSETVGDFVDDLARFDAATLKAAMAKLRAECKRKPTLAHVVEACQAHRSPAHAAAGQNPRQPWHDRGDAVDKLRNDYLALFKSTATMWGEACREGWDFYLLEYVSAVASHQAQLIAGVKNCGFSGAIFGPQVTDEQIEIFLREQKRIADTGQIDVAIPTGKIAEWKRVTAWRKDQQDAAKHPAAASPKPNLNPGIEEYLDKMAEGKAVKTLSSALESAA